MVLVNTGGASEDWWCFSGTKAKVICRSDIVSTPLIVALVVVSQTDLPGSACGAAYPAVR